MKILNWGIIGSGKIAHKFAENIKLVRNASLIACSSKDEWKAKEFAKKYDIEYSYASYEEMLENNEINAVYIATTHNFHYENALLCLMHGKAILCEKAFTVNSVQAKEIFEFALEKRLFVMEGMWTRFLPVTRWVKEKISLGEIGEPISVFTQFGIKFPYDPASRAFNINLAGGGLLDLGIYAISIACNILGHKPVKVIGNAKIGKTGVDEHASISFIYNKGQIATITYSMISDYDNEVEIFGTSGIIKIDNICAPMKATIIREDKSVLIFENQDTNGFEYEIKEATDLILKGELESPGISWKETLRIMEICDELRRQWCLKYPEEIGVML